MSLLWKLAALALGAALLSAVLRERGREFVVPLQIACGALMLGALFAAAKDRLASLTQLLTQTDVGAADVSLLLKGAAVCVVTELCAALCRENGNGAVGEVLVLSGRLLTLLLALPLLENVISLALSFCG